MRVLPSYLSKVQRHIDLVELGAAWQRRALPPSLCPVNGVGDGMGAITVPLGADVTVLALRGKSIFRWFPVWSGPGEYELLNQPLVWTYKPEITWEFFIISKGTSTFRTSESQEFTHWFLWDSTPQSLCFHPATLLTKNTSESQLNIHEKKRFRWQRFRPWRYQARVSCLSADPALVTPACWQVWVQLCPLVLRSCRPRSLNQQQRCCEWKWWSFKPRRTFQATQLIRVENWKDLFI